MKLLKDVFMGVFCLNIIMKFQVGISLERFFNQCVLVYGCLDHICVISGSYLGHIWVISGSCLNVTNLNPKPNLMDLFIKKSHVYSGTQTSESYYTSLNTAYTMAQVNLK